MDKQTVRRQLDGYEEEEYPDQSGRDLYRAMRCYPRMGSGDRCGLQFPDPGSNCRVVKERPDKIARKSYPGKSSLRYVYKELRILIGICCSIVA